MNNIWDVDIQEGSVVKCWTKASCMPLIVENEVEGGEVVEEPSNVNGDDNSIENEDLCRDGFV